MCKSMDNLYLLSETNMENILKVTEELNPKFLIIDSIQTMFSIDMESAPGSVSQVRHCTNELMRIGREKHTYFYSCPCN